VCAAIACHGRETPLRLAWIADTLHTDLIGVSPVLLEEARGRDDLKVEPPLAPMPFEGEGRL